TSGKLFDFSSNMNSSLVLHVLNAVVVSNMNTSSSNGNVTNEQIYLKNYDMITLMTSWDMLSNQYFNNAWKLKVEICAMCKCLQQLYQWCKFQIRSRCTQKTTYTSSPKHFYDQHNAAQEEFIFQNANHKYLMEKKNVHEKKKGGLRISRDSKGFFLKKNKNSNRLSNDAFDSMPDPDLLRNLYSSFDCGLLAIIFTSPLAILKKTKTKTVTDCQVVK
ncbi:hypothetical protein RFI_29359, partial [Reticulomyxa filosa]